MSRLDPIREAQAVTSLRESLAKVLGDDEDDALLRDSIEGETGFYEAVDAILERMAETRGLKEGAAAAVDRMKLRAKRFDDRLESLRGLLEQSMQVAGLPKLERPAATLSISKRAIQVEVTEESELPSAYFVVGPPKLDKKLLLDAMKRRQAILDAYAELPEAERAERVQADLQASNLPLDITGAELVQPAPSLTIRNS